MKIIHFLFCIWIFHSSATVHDIECLKSIKNSFEDPHGHLTPTWNFNDSTDGFFCHFNGVDCWNNNVNRVFGLNLFGMGLKGQIPLGIRNCTLLQVLILSKNELHGSIPDQLFELPFLVAVDLSFNSFTGTIPASIANTTYLNNLRLNDNYLTGEIPRQIGRLNRLKEFNVANNMLSGEVPNFENGPTVPKESYAGNDGLCGGPLGKCRPKRSFAGGFAVGYAVSAFTVMVVYASYFVPCLRVGRNNNITAAAMILAMIRRMRFKKTPLQQVVSLSVDETLDKQIGKLEQIGIMAKRLHYADMSRATDNFSESAVIGKGETGTMYKATIANGCFFAVKKFHGYESLGERFVSELRILGSFKHVNLLPLLGFCTKPTERLLVYKYMPNGSLYDWLHPNNTMDWHVRVKVAVGLARGLAWLHQDQGTDIRIIHLGLCSKCVLLDENFEPKISNVGDAMVIGSDSINRANTQLGLEIDYMKEDVLSFGMVLLELITKIDSTEIGDSCDGGKEECMKRILSECSGDYCDVVDEFIIGKGFDGEVYGLLEVAFECIESIPERRPTIVQVYHRTKMVAGTTKTVKTGGEIELN